MSTDDFQMMPVAHEVPDERALEREAAKVAAEALAKQRLFLRTKVMQDPDGRKWVFDLLEEFRIFSTTFHIEPAASAYNEGQRSVALRIYRDILTSAPDEYLVMLKENSSEQA